MDNEQGPLKLPVWLGYCFIAAQLLLNKWSVEFFAKDHINNGLAPCTYIFMFCFNLYFIMAGVAIIKKYPLPVKSFAIYAILMFVMIFPYILFAQSLGYSLSDLQCHIFGQLYALVLFLPLIMLAPFVGSYIALVIMMLVGLVITFYMYYYNSDFGLSVFFVLFETNLKESGGFLSERIFSVPVISCLVLSVILLLIVKRLMKGVSKGRLRFVYLLFTFPALLFLLNSDGRIKLPTYNFFVKIVNSYNAYNRAQAETVELANLPLDKIEEVRVPLDRPEKELHILIIGESCDRDHMSIYGYPRKTNPRLESMKDELFCFDNMISTYYNTIPAINSLLTFDKGDGQKALIIHYLKKAGYKTFWISNQNPMGMHETVTTIYAGSCDESFFMNISDTYRQTAYDQDILPILANVLDDENSRKFIFIHLMGQHEPYRLRYPNDYDVFKGHVPGKTDRQSEIINNYDNATLYNDYIVSTIINKMNEQGIYGTVTYMSDHGNEVYDVSDYSGHTFKGGLEVPFIIWVSPDYRAAKSQVISRWPDYLHRPGVSGCEKYTIFDLVDVDFDSFKPQMSLVNPDFQPTVRIVGPDKQQWNYDVDK